MPGSIRAIRLVTNQTDIFVKIGLACAGGNPGFTSDKIEPTTTDEWLVVSVEESNLFWLCTNALLAVVGLSAYWVVRFKNQVIVRTQSINHDLYHEIIFPNRKSYEADATGLAALFFYARFRWAILSNEFPELS